LLASWLGAAILFSAAVAPNVFRVLREFAVSNTSEIAGTIVSRTLSVVNLSGLIISVILILSAIVLRRSYGARALVIQIGLLVLVAAATLVGEWIIAARMRSLRAGLSIPLEQLAATDPVRVTFDSLHGYSVAALGIAIIAALIAFFVVAHRVRE
jgi:hypothetical protein